MSLWRTPLQEAGPSRSSAGSNSANGGRRGIEGISEADEVC